MYRESGRNSAHAALVSKDTISSHRGVHSNDALSPVRNPGQPSWASMIDRVGDVPTIILRIQSQNSTKKSSDIIHSISIKYRRDVKRSVSRNNLKIRTTETGTDSWKLYIDIFQSEKAPRTVILFKIHRKFVMYNELHEQTNDYIRSLNEHESVEQTAMKHYIYEVVTVTSCHMLQIFKLLISIYLHALIILEDTLMTPEPFFGTHVLLPLDTRYFSIGNSLGNRVLFLLFA